MRFRASVFAAVLIAAGASSASAAVSESQFPPHTVADLIAICAPAKDDPLMTGAVNFCHGYTEGAVVVEEAHEAQRGGHKLFCLPTPRPPRSSELASFIAWANERPARLDMPAIDGMFILSRGEISLSGVGGRETEMAMKRLILAAVMASVPLAACSDMTPGQQRALSGTAIGAGGGAIIGAIAGNAGLGAGIGAAAGLAGGLIYNQARGGN